MQTLSFSESIAMHAYFVNDVEEGWMNTSYSILQNSSDIEDNQTSSRPHDSFKVSGLQGPGLRWDSHTSPVKTDKMSRSHAWVCEDPVALCIDDLIAEYVSLNTRVPYSFVICNCALILVSLECLKKVSQRNWSLYEEFQFISSGWRGFFHLCVYFF
jgi:hypothetical protein